MSTTATFRSRLEELRAERAAARLCGLTSQPSYMTDLDDEIAICRAAYVGLAISEIATFRAQLGGRCEG